MNYHAVIDGKAAGPYTAQQLVGIGIKEDTLVWYQGLSDWIMASSVPEIMDALAAARQSVIPEITQDPVQVNVEQVETIDHHDTEEYAVENEHINNGQPEEVQEYGTTVGECPEQHLGLAIFSAIMFPTGIAAIVKTVLIKTRWEQGRYDDARWLAKTARKYSIMSIIIGVILCAIFIMYYMLVLFILFGY